jgi:ATP-dependent DNA helicase MPH1
VYKDEAHRATGDYAYNQAIRFLMAKNPHFRVLALTATPGNKGEAVQVLVDGLHISRIEIRDEQSLDLKPYIHKKVSKAEGYFSCVTHFLAQIFKPHIIKANEELAKVRDLLVRVMEVCCIESDSFDFHLNIMQPFMKPVQQAQLLFPSEMATSLHPYRPQMIMTKLLPHQRGLCTPLSMLGKLARAMLYLVGLSVLSCGMQLITTE